MARIVQLVELCVAEVCRRKRGVSEHGIHPHNTLQHGTLEVAPSEVGPRKVRLNEPCALHRGVGELGISQCRLAHVCIREASEGKVEFLEVGSREVHPFQVCVA